MDRDAKPEVAEGKPAVGGVGSSAGFQGFSFSKVSVDGRHVNQEVLRKRCCVLHSNNLWRRLNIIEYASL